MCLIVFSLAPSLGPSTPLPGHCDWSMHSSSASPWGVKRCVCVPWRICVYVGRCVFIKRNVSRWRPPITKESTTSPFSFMQPVPTLLSLLWQPALSPWALHASNQSETFVEIPPGSTYSTYPTGTASTLKRLEQRAQRLPHQSLGWHQKLGLQGWVTGNAEVIRSQELRDVRRKAKTGWQCTAMANFSGNYVE